MRSYQHEVSPEFVTTTVTPARLASLESDVFVPVLQGIAVGVSVGILGGVGTLLLGGPVAHLQGGVLWAWAGRLAGVSFALGLSGSVVAFVLGHRRAIWQRERRLGRDIDGDGYVGEPDTVRVEMVSDNGKHSKYTDLPVSMDELCRPSPWPSSRMGSRSLVRVCAVSSPRASTIVSPAGWSRGDWRGICPATSGS